MLQYKTIKLQGNAKSLSFIVELRTYQAQAIRQIGLAFNRHDRVMYQLPTAGGKTIIFSHLVNRYRQWHPDKKILLIAHRRELIKQMITKLRAFGVDATPIYGGARVQSGYPVYCASINKLSKQTENLQDVGFIIVDEAHHYCQGNIYERVLRRYNEAKILGVTATPWRLDRKGFDDFFEHLIEGPTIRELINARYLCSYRAYTARVQPDLTAANNNSELDNDYNEDDLIAACSDAKVLGDLVDHWKEHANGRPTIVFGIRINHSIEIARRYQAAGIPAAHLDSTTKLSERELILSKFQHGEIKALVNCDIVSEGFDAPNCSCIQLARPTKSLTLYLQQVGRGLRTDPSKKDCIILDHGQTMQAHGLPDDDRIWSLAPRPANYYGSRDGEGGEDREFTPAAADGGITEDANQRLIEISSDIPSRIEELVRIAELNNYRKGWAYFKALELFPHPKTRTLEFFKTLEKQLGYRRGWAKHKFKEFQEESDNALCV